MIIKSLKNIRWYSGNEQPKLQPFVKNGVELFAIAEDIEYGFWEYGEPTEGFLLTIRKGFVMDGQSSPAFGRFYMPRNGKVSMAAAAHDALNRSMGGRKKVAPYKESVALFPEIDYTNRVSIETTKGERVIFDRKAVDQIYLAAYRAADSSNRPMFGYVCARLLGKKYFGSVKTPAEIRAERKNKQ